MPSKLSIVLALVGSVAPLRDASSQVVQNFDQPGGTPYRTASCLNPPMEVSPVLIGGGPTDVGRFQRLAFVTPVPNHGSVTFDYVDAGAFDRVVADFDLRMTPGDGQADGIGFALLSVAEFGETGLVCPQAPQYVADEPNFAKSLGIGFDIHQAPGADLNDNHVSIHFDGIEQAEFDVTSAISLAGTEWIHARILVDPGVPSGILVTIILTPRGGHPFTVVQDFSLWWVPPYRGRVHFAGRSGGESASHDLDNVEVSYLDATESTVSLSAVSYDVVETDAQALVTVARSGNSTRTVTVAYGTKDGTANGNSDYVPRYGTLTFSAGEMQQSFLIPLLNDDLNEGDETFLVFLESPSAGAALAGPSTAGVRTVDDESGRLLGHWSRIVSLPTIAIHTHLLPTGKVLFWQEGGAVPKVQLWNPLTGRTRRAAPPPYDVFCSGHSFLADGRLLVTGGHEHMDGVGVRNATIYDARGRRGRRRPRPTGAWQRNIPLMGGEGGRWYPTNTTLGNGDVVVLSGSYDAAFRMNTLPQVFEAERLRWRDLNCAQELEPLGGDLYPRMFLAPDGRVFKVGDPTTWFLDASGCGQWTKGPPSLLQRTRTYGPAVLYDAKVLVIGGGGGADDPVPPSQSVEIIDLNAANPQWAAVAPMAFPRRHHNATLLPDGTTLVTGGTSCAGFNCAAGAVLAAELWDPAAGSWSTLGSMAGKRLYHSTALLLPDGRVLSAGGGRPAASGEVDRRDAEIFSPPYLFTGPRPSITFAPAKLAWGQAFSLETPNASSIGKVSLVRLGSVTHAFDQNQRLLSLPFTAAGTGLTVTVPSNSNLAPPGHYMLFIVNGDGVPSLAQIVRVGNAND